MWIFVGFIGTILWAVGLYRMYVSSTHFTGDIREAFRGLIAAGTFFAASATLAILLSVPDIPSNRAVQMLIPTLYVPAMAFWGYGIVKLLRLTWRSSQ